MLHGRGDAPSGRRGRDAFVSAGSTGALIMGGTFIVKRIKGVSRAALAPLMPSRQGAVHAAGRRG